MTSGAASSDIGQVMRKALVLRCWPPGADLPLGDVSFLVEAGLLLEFAVSYSAQQHGWLRQLARVAGGLAAGGVSASASASVPAAVPVHGPQTAEQLYSRIGSFDLLLVAPLSPNSLAKFALGIRDSFPAMLFGEFVDRRLPVLLDDSFMRSFSADLHPHLARIYRQHWERLTGPGIMALDHTDSLGQIRRLLRQLDRMTTHPASTEAVRTVITRADVVEAAATSASLMVPSGAIITDLAREEAAQLGLTFRFPT